MNEEIENLLDRENLTLASISKRSMVLFIDETLLSFILIFSLWNSFVSAKSVEEVILLVNQFTLEYIALKIIYQAFFVMKYGATLGKIAMKIRVIDINTIDNPNVISSLNRAIFRIISEMLFYMGFLWAMFDPQKQAWHDKTARTLVVNV
jgi:uncharacterized RDD family membrane protein YckC